MIDRGMLEYVLNRIRPQIQADGGDLKVTKIDDDEGVVYVALQGACVDCPMSTVTMSQGVERVVVEHVPGVKHVRADMQETTMANGQSLEDAVMAQMNGAPTSSAAMGMGAGMGMSAGMGMGNTTGIAGGMGAGAAMGAGMGAGAAMGAGMANTTAAANSMNATGSAAANSAAVNSNPADSTPESDISLPNMGGGFGGAAMGGPMAGMGDDGYRDNPYLDWEDDDDDE